MYNGGKHRSELLTIHDYNIVIKITMVVNGLPRNITNKAKTPHPQVLYSGYGLFIWV